MGGKLEPCVHVSFKILEIRNIKAFNHLSWSEFVIMLFALSHNFRSSYKGQEVDA